MTLTVSEIDEKNVETLKTLMADERFQQPFGPAALQRKLMIGYNKAARLMQSGIQAGILYVPEDKPYWVAFKRHSGAESNYEHEQTPAL